MFPFAESTERSKRINNIPASCNESFKFDLFLLCLGCPIPEQGKQNENRSLMSRDITFVQY